ncbi:DNA cytosine methyltransferase [Terrisporobacter petrolearius]|uniref:DNA cytosine methyltransferase n=1 Tax=Terrisporobacter petrolearius TaxID=1460447 RepID=UPI003AFFA856
MTKEKPNIIDLFCGCGGLSLGFTMAGCKSILAIDNNEPALETYRQNHHAPAKNIDLFDVNIADKVHDIIGDKSVDLIIGGPPCQGFSLTGTRDEKDDRNQLYKSMVRLVERFKPKAFVIENVPGILTLYKGKAKEAILKEFGELGYSINYKVLYAPDYGVPQIRRRTFFVGLRNGLGTFEFPKPILTEDEYVSCRQAIDDLPPLTSNLGKPKMDYIKNAESDYQKFMRKNSNTVYNHEGTKHTEEVINVISQVPEGGNHKDLPPGVGDSRKFNEAWTRYHGDKPSKTIDTGHRNHFHYKWNRVPTVRENARLQSFPDDFVFYGNKTQQYRQVGNAVPPLLAYHLAKKILEYL